MMIRLFLIISLTCFSLTQNAQVPSAIFKIESKVNSNELSKEEKVIHEHLKSPQETMRTFMKGMDKVKNGDSSGFTTAIETIDLSLIDPPLRQLTGKITAERLVNTMDRIAKIDLSTIPSYENGPRWYFRKQTINIGEETHDVEIALSKSKDGNWRFTSETVDTIENFFSAVARQKVVQGNKEYRNWKTRLKERMPIWTSDEFLMFKKGQWIGLFLILIFSVILFHLVRKVITSIIRLKVRSRSLEMSEFDQYPSTRSFGYLAFALTWLVGVRFLELDVEMLESFVRASYILTAFFFVWSALKIVDYISLHFEKQAESTVNKFDDVLIPMLKKTSKVIVISFGILLIAHSLTFDIASIIAGLGIGGVAVALAAKDTISNFFGSVTVIIDRPFQIGDYIILDKGIEGAVEEVGFRSTRLRTPVKSLVTIPNSVLANMAIDNYGMRRVRRLSMTLQMEYDTPVEKLQEFCDRIHFEIQLNPMLLKDEPMVNINELAQSSVNLALTVYIQTTDLKIEIQEKHKFIKRILQVADEVGVKFAIPARKLLMEQVSPL